MQNRLCKESLSRLSEVSQVSAKGLVPPSCSPLGGANCVFIFPKSVFVGPKSVFVLLSCFFLHEVNKKTSPGRLARRRGWECVGRSGYSSPRICMISMAERMTLEPGPKMAATPAL